MAQSFALPHGSLASSTGDVLLRVAADEDRDVGRRRRLDQRARPRGYVRLGPDPKLLRRWFFNGGYDGSFNG